MGADVVIVGAGPVGLWTAIQIKKRSPQMSVQLYERHEEYQRSHVLQLEYASMLWYSKHAKTPEERAFYQEITGKSLSQLFGAAVGGSVFIRTNDLEAALKKHAKSLGINIAYKKIDSPEQVEALHPECQQFIAADGAHSKMREAIMGKNAIDTYPLQYVVEAKYQANGATRKLGPKKQYKTNKLLSSMAFEYIGREKEGTTPVTVRFFVDEETYNATPEATFKEPLRLDSPGLPATLAKDIETYMRVRKNKAGERYTEGSAKLSKLTLSLYRAKDFATTHAGRSWFLAGDAAMGVPYFRSLNAGMIIGSQLAFILTRRALSAEQKIVSYNLCRPLDVSWEFTAARGKDMALKAYDMFRQASSKVPWEMVKWRGSERDQFQNKPPRPPQGKKPPF